MSIPAGKVKYLVVAIDLDSGQVVQSYGDLYGAPDQPQRVVTTSTYSLNLTRQPYATTTRVEGVPESQRLQHANVEHAIPSKWKSELATKLRGPFRRKPFKLVPVQYYQQDMTRPMRSATKTSVRRLQRW